MNVFAFLTSHDAESRWPVVDVLSSLQTIPTAAAGAQCVATYLGVSTAVSWPSRTAWLA